jgi:hypothetical protein
MASSKSQRCRGRLRRAPARQLKHRIGLESLARNGYNRHRTTHVGGKVLPLVGKRNSEVQGMERKGRDSAAGAGCMRCGGSEVIASLSADVIAMVSSKGDNLQRGGQLRHKKLERISCSESCACKLPPHLQPAYVRLLKALPSLPVLGYQC